MTTHYTDRIARHFARLKRQTRGLVDWHLLHNPTNAPAPLTLTLDPAPEAVMPERHRQMMKAGGMLPGYPDVLTVTAALSLPYPYVWVMEYDVDFSGHWRRFFEAFADNDADLLTSSLLPLSQDPGWYFAPGVGTPEAVDPDARTRAFHPVMRMSRRMLEAYAEAVRDPAWHGHFEFVVPTVARHLGLKVEDIGGAGPFCPPERRGAFYANTPLHPHLSPGTFVWRPTSPHYFHERAKAFAVPDMLLHPVKVEGPAPPWRLSNALRVARATWFSPRRRPS